MATKKNGWIMLYRDLLDSAIWTSDIPFDERSAWIDLLLIVNHKDGQVFTKQKGCIDVPRGSTLTSIRKLAERWHWSPNRVRRYLDTLRHMKMVEVDTQSDTRSGTLLTVVKYDDFQVRPHTHGYTNGYTDEHTDGYGDGYGDETQTINKKINNEKNEEEDHHPHGGWVLAEDGRYEWDDTARSSADISYDSRQLDISQGTERSRVQQLRDLLHGITIVPGGGSATGDSECDP